MRKLFILLGLFLTFSVSGQIPGIFQSQSRAVAGGGGYNVIFQGVLDAMTVDPTLDTLAAENALAGSLDSLVTVFTGTGFTTFFDVFYVFAQRNLQGASLDWTDPTGDDNISDGATTTFTKYSGFTGDAAVDYLTTNFTLSTEAVNATATNITMAAFLQTNEAANTSIFGAQNVSPTKFYRLSPKIAVGNMSVLLGNSSAYAIANSTSKGLMLVTRPHVDTLALYVNGSQLSKVLNSANANGFPNVPIYLLAYNYDSVVTGRSGNTISVFFISKGMSNVLQAKIYTIIERFMDKIGKGS